MTGVEVDCRDITSTESFHDLVAEALNFPGYYGRNINAFWDCLTEIFEDVEIEFLNYDLLSKDVRWEITDYIYLMFEYQERTDRKFTIRLRFPARAGA